MLGVTALKAQTQKQWRDSLSVINSQLYLHPDSTDLLLQKAAVNLQLLEWEDAAETCNAILKKDTVNLSALYFRAYANNNMRRYELARNDYETSENVTAQHAGTTRTGIHIHQLKRNAQAMDESTILLKCSQTAASSMPQEPNSRRRCAHTKRHCMTTTRRLNASPTTKTTSFQRQKCSSVWTGSERQKPARPARKKRSCTRSAEGSVR